VNAEEEVCGVEGRIGTCVESSTLKASNEKDTIGQNLVSRLLLYFQ